MSYATVSLLARDGDFINRCNAAAATEIPAASPTHPINYVQEHVWTMAASPGFDAAYDSALATGVGRPGWESSVISDTEILSAMQALLAAVPPDPVPGA